MNPRLLKLAQTFVASTLIVAASSCVTIERGTMTNHTAPAPRDTAPQVVPNETPAAPQVGYVRIRGAITAVAEDAVTVRTRTGQELRVKLGKTPINAITRAEITDIKLGSFIGTAATSLPDGSLRALEVHIYPDRAGAGDGHQPWDLGPDSSMTNGMVGDVVGSKDRTLTVEYKGGQKKVVVPDVAPIVHIQRGDLSLLKPDVPVFIMSTKAADGTLYARSISAGKDGVTPPM
jgi:hypothetical protein